MSNVSIYEKNWIDLVFEDKNKLYGAYQLRQENQKTTLLALLGGITFVLALIGMGLFLSSFNDDGNHVTITTPVYPTITPVDLSNSLKKDPVQPKTEPTESQKMPDKPNLAHMVVAATNDVKDNVPKNKEVNTQPTNTQGTAGGTETGKPTESGSPGGIALIPVVDNTPKGIGELDRLPEYPGGMKKFYEYVGNNIEKPEIEENVTSVSVFMSFVIERDGSMSEIKVLRSTDKNLEREAIRVLKALKIKWSPGYKDGAKMRTLYTLPIKVAL